MTLHHSNSVVSMLANIHLAASLPNCDWLELPYDPPAFTHDGRDRLLAEPLRVDADGMVRIAMNQDGLEQGEEVDVILF